MLYAQPVPVKETEVEKTLRLAEVVPSCVNVPLIVQVADKFGPVKVMPAPVPVGVTVTCQISAKGSSVIEASMEPEIAATEPVKGVTGAALKGADPEALLALPEI